MAGAAHEGGSPDGRYQLDAIQKGARSCCRPASLRRTTMHCCTMHRVRGWFPCFLGAFVLLGLIGLSLTSSRADKPNVPADKAKGPAQTSYDQVSPVLLGQESFEAMMAKDKQ